MVNLIAKNRKYKIVKEMKNWRY